MENVPANRRALDKTGDADAGKMLREVLQEVIFVCFYIIKCSDSLLTRYLFQGCLESASLDHSLKYTDLDERHAWTVLQSQASEILASNGLTIAPHQLQLSEWSWATCVFMVIGGLLQSLLSNTYMANTFMALQPGGLPRYWKKTLRLPCTCSKRGMGSRFRTLELQSLTCGTVLRLIRNPIGWTIPPGPYEQKREMALNWGNTYSTWAFTLEKG